MAIQKRRQTEVSKRGTVNVYYGKHARGFYVDDWWVSHPDEPHAKAGYKRTYLRTTLNAAKKDALRVAKALRSFGFKARTMSWNDRSSQHVSVARTAPKTRTAKRLKTRSAKTRSAKTRRVKRKRRTSRR